MWAARARPGSAGGPGVRTVTAGSAVLPVRIFGEFLKKTPHDKVSLEIDDERGTLSAGRNRTRFATWPVSEFPNIPRSDGAAPLCTIVAADLARAISEGSVASSTPADFPKYLGACLLKAQRDLLKIVATDGKRLSLSQCPCEAGAEVDLLLPIPALKELVRLLMGNAPESRIDVLYDGSTVWFRLEGLVHRWMLHRLRSRLGIFYLTCSCSARSTSQKISQARANWALCLGSLGSLRTLGR